MGCLVHRLLLLHGKERVKRLIWLKVGFQIVLAYEKLSEMLQEDSTMRKLYDCLFFMIHNVRQKYVITYTSSRDEDVEMAVYWKRYFCEGAC